MQCDILNLEFASKCRDVDIVEPILSYLELKYGLKVVREHLANFDSKFIECQPEVLVISNEVGAVENFKAVKLASKLGIKTVTLIAEGDLPGDKDGVEEFFWGWNKDHIFYEDLHLEWSQRAVDLIRKTIPGSDAHNIKVSGATGFDKYKILPFASREAFLSKYKKEKYKRVVGVGGWAFDRILSDYYKEFRDAVDNTFGKEYINLHAKSKEPLRMIYKRIIEENPDTLFIIKHHPGVMYEEHTEFYNLDEYDNTLVIRGLAENIADVINVSDMWLAYESTTCLEAWLLGKQTMLINPLGGDFKRSSISKGSPITTSYKEAQEAINAFYKNGSLLGFKELEKDRKRVITRVIEWDDGKNHIRAGDYIYDLFMDNKKKHRAIDGFVLKSLFKTSVRNLIFKTGLIRLSPFAKKYKDLLEFNKLFDPTERESEHQKYLKYLKEFYARSNIQLKS